MAKLYELPQQMQEINDNMDLLQDHIDEGKLTEDQAEHTRESIKESLNDIEMKFEEKVENCYKFMKNLEGEAEMYRTEEQRLRKMRQAAENKAQRMKDYIAEQMKNAGYDHKNKKKIITPIGKIGFQKNPPTVEITDETQVPYSFIKRVEKIWDMNELKKHAKEKLGDAAKDTDEFDFEEEGFRYVNNRSHLRVR